MSLLIIQDLEKRSLNDNRLIMQTIVYIPENTISLTYKCQNNYEVVFKLDEIERIG